MRQVRTLKDVYYFPHDSNAHGDEKIKVILAKYGMIGYGLYWIFIESMHEQTDGKLTCALVEGVAFGYNVDITELKQFYNDAIAIGLFVTDGEKYWSERVLRNKHEFDEKRIKKSLAGIKGMRSRWGSKDSEKQCNNDDISEHNKGKEIKEKKNNIYSARFTPPTVEEIKTYCSERHNSVDPQKWYDHYTSNGWMVGKNKMKDWKAAVRTWESTDQRSPPSKYRDMTKYEPGE
jgi:hypothetical protein